jgi:putative N6-adenine-specific DNA methylase
MEKVTLIATAAMGLEALVAKEVRDLGYECTTENGKVTFQAEAKDIPRVNLWLRTADRVKLKVGEFKAYSFDELFEKTKALNWGDIIPAQAEFPVTGKSVKSKLFSVSDCQRIVKKAIVFMISAMITAAMTPPLAPIITQGAETLEAEEGINKKTLEKHPH